MSQEAKIAAVQMCSSDNVDENLQAAKKLIARAARAGASIIVLPENFILMDCSPEQRVREKEEYGAGKIQDFLSTQAKQHQVWIVGGTIPIACYDENRVRASCIVFDDKGNAVARYDKMHLFDVIISDTESYQESKSIQAGEQTVVVDTPFGKLGLAVCYDLRFPELFRCMEQQGAEIFCLPTAFTVKTGKVHWESLTRARAIENLCYLVAACQTGRHTHGRLTYGHSQIIDPWGAIKQCLPEESGIIIESLNLEYCRSIRKTFPALEHRKIEIHE